MIEINFSEEDLVTLKNLQNQHPHHHVIRRRALILLLKHQNIAHHQIAAITQTCENTVRQCFLAYLNQGIELVMTLNFYKPSSQLKSFDEKIKSHFEHKPPANIAQACAEIKTLTGVSIKTPR